ncbi:hypothetical protein YM3MPS_34730 [Mycobacterium pseudoshottsii]|nr:hypothetical protein [Mycobacterium pseudoshottsii]RFZ69670.1 hypothetical protein DL240490_01420 [Mycobacterium marinum]BEH77670.1 hypothetical protein YM3MPS_34730 [Mycobacterium pseudoshottsii]
MMFTGMSMAPTTVVTSCPATFPSMNSRGWTSRRLPRRPPRVVAALKPVVAADRPRLPAAPSVVVPV